MFRFLLLLQLIRSINLCIASTAIFLTFFIFNEPISFLTFYCVGVVIGSMASGYIINDILDVESDLINKKNNLIAKNFFSYKEAHCLNIFFIFICVYCSFFINHQSLLFLYFFIFPLLLAYNFFLKKYIFIGNICVATMLSSIFLFTGLILNAPIKNIYMIAVFCFFLNLIREMIKDLNDIDGDKFKNMKTFPIVLGERKTIYMIQFLIFFLFVFLLIHSAFFSIKYYFSAMIFLVEIPLLYSLFLLYRYYSKKTIYQLTFLYKFINVTGLFVIIFMKEIF